MPLSDKAKAMLAKDRLFQSLPEEARPLFLERLMTQRVRGGEWIYRLGDTAGGIYFIADHVLYKEGPDSKTEDEISEESPSREQSSGKVDVNSKAVQDEDAPPF